MFPYMIYSAYYCPPFMKVGPYLTDNYYFLLIGVKTYGAYGPQGIKLVKQIGKKHQRVYLLKKSTLGYIQMK